MSKFAKLFNVADTQVLYVLEEDDDGNPGVRMTTHVDGVVLTLMPTFDGYGDFDKAWEKAEALFEALDQESADRFHPRMAQQFRDLVTHDEDAP